MTIETSSANNLFAGFNDDEKKMLAVAVRRVEELEETRRITAGLAGQAQAIQSDLKARGVDDGAVLREAAEAVAATASAQGKLASEVDGYRKLFGPDGRAAAAVGQYTQLLRNAHAGDVEALNSVQSARRELYEARDASAQHRSEADAGQDQAQGRYVVRAIDSTTLESKPVLATTSALQAFEAFNGKADREIFDQQSNRLVGYIGLGQDGTLPQWKTRAEFTAAIDAERPPERTPAKGAENTVEQDGPERAKRPDAAQAQPDPAKIAERDDRQPQADLRHALPESFVGRYVRSGDKWVEAGNAEHVILVDKGAKLQVPRQFDAESVKATVDVAEARGWGSMKVSGDEKFRQAVYLEAASRGIEVKGYNPSEAERKWAADAAGKNPRTQNMAIENDVAKSFHAARTPAERRQAAEKHPELKKAFAIEAAYSQLAKQIHGKSGQDAFMARMRDNIATDLAQGRELADVRLRRPMFKQQEFDRSQQRDQDRGR